MFHADNNTTKKDSTAERSVAGYLFYSSVCVTVHKVLDAFESFFSIFASNNLKLCIKITNSNLKIVKCEHVFTECNVRYANPH